MILCVTGHRRIIILEVLNVLGVNADSDVFITSMMQKLSMLKKYKYMYMHEE